VRDHAHTTETTAEGRFWIGGLSPGDYTLVAEASSDTATRTLTVPGPDYDIVIGRDADVAKQPEKTGREVRAKRTAR